tara:strand:- start:54537 stop:55562 length:1026 start_codon:yes stop_codon:yes gene_type:complete
MAEEDKEKQDDGPSGEAEESKAPNQESEEEDSDEISLDDIDALLNEVAPDFEDELKAIEDSASDMEGADLEDSVPEEVQLTFEEKFPKIYRIIAPILGVLSKFKLVNRVVGAFWRRVFSITQRLYFFVKDGLLKFFHLVKTYIPIWINFIVSNSKDFFSYLSSQVKNFLKLPLKVKIMAFISVVLFAVTALFAYKTGQGIWLPILKDKPLVSFYGQAQYQGSINPKGELVPYHTAFPQPEYTLLLKHMVISLKRDRFDSTPMAAFEFFLNLDSEDTAVEVKDREPQMLDAIQRVVENYTYNELNSYDGLKAMKKSIVKELNTMLNYGIVRDIYIKTKVLKP